jgi:hypothetical protein
MLTKAEKLRRHRAARAIPATGTDHPAPTLQAPSAPLTPLRVVVRDKPEALPLDEVLAAVPSGAALRVVDNEGQEYLWRRSLADRALDRPRAPGTPRVLQQTYLSARLADLRRALRGAEFLIVVVCETSGLAVLKRRIA